MSKPYSILNKLPHEAFLDPTQFVTYWDGINPAKAEEQYQTGLDHGHKAKRITICANGTWAADMLNGGMITSYEGIGYHAHTSSLLKGFLDSGAEIVVCRYADENAYAGKVIRPKITDQKAESVA